MAVSKGRGTANRGAGSAAGHGHKLGALELAYLRMPEIVALRTLQGGLADLAAAVADRRLSLYRDYVGATVSRVSPLLVRWCALEGFDLDQVATMLRPDRPWSAWICGPRPTAPASWRSVTAFRPSQSIRGGTALHDLRRFAFSGVAVRVPPAPGAFGVRVLHDCLEFACMLGNARLRTFRGGGSLLLPHRLPATLAAALPGRTLDALVEHRVLDGAGCVVRDVREHTTRGTEVCFGLRPTAWRMPWARGARSRPDVR